ncbi:MAG: hypothetical protein GWN18_17260, partial [Thermoplasmata archaeon]|nr:hypothetical protein [Thermoplasmata archaeon]NIS13861.1 hypothetical protein [Thermoplasmata archaeon]NIS21708.1 hypothetical protein [Thermoplasmata archaeon]NIT79302.1 hypothetical protein [Thermoplasmata archaeon]NIU50741.1 hypothetical protein [Thermoplasmata archaeon]
LYTLKSEYHTYYLTEGPPPTDRINHDYFYANLYAYNLQGDPEVPVWMGEPGRLDLEVLGGAVFNSPAMRVRVTDVGTGEPLEGATVHARGAGLPGLMEVATDANGIAVLPEGPNVMGEEIRLAVTKDNWVPDREIIVVGEGLSDVSLTDADLAGPSAEPFNDQTLTFQVTVHNTGDFPLTGVEVHFDSGDLAANGNGGATGRNASMTVDIFTGASRTLEFTHRYTEPGEYDVVVRADPDDMIVEASELDNEAIHHLSLWSSPGFPSTIGPFD